MNPEKLFFNTHQSKFFEELYEFSTGTNDYKILENPRNLKIKIAIEEENPTKINRFAP